MSLLLPPPAGHAATEDPQLQAAVESFLYEQLVQAGDEVEIKVLPPPALLPKCENPVPFLPSTTRRRWRQITVGVHCGANVKSVRYMQAQVSAIGNYFTIARQIPANTLVTRTLLEVVRGDKSQLPPNTIFDAEAALGQLTKQQLAAGTIVQSQHLYRPPLVQSSQQVTIEAQGPGFNISRTAQALESGALGDKIKVRIGRQQTLDAVIIGVGRVSPEP